MFGVYLCSIWCGQLRLQRCTFPANGLRSSRPRGAVRGCSICKTRKSSEVGISSLITISLTPTRLNCGGFTRHSFFTGDKECYSFGRVLMISTSPPLKSEIKRRSWTKSITPLPDPPLGAMVPICWSVFPSMIAICPLEDSPT